MRVYSIKSWKGKLDKMAGEHYRSRPCDCISTIPGHVCAGRLEWVHCKTRKILKTRWMPENNFTLCSKAHFAFHDHPDLFIAWIEKTWPERINILNEALKDLKTIKKSDLQELYTNLSAELKGGLK